MPRWTLLTALAVATAGCATASSPPPAPVGEPTEASASRAEPAAASKAVRWARDSAEHRALFLEVFRAATAHVETAAATREDGTWAVVVDADETILDNSVYQVEREQQGLEFTRESWHEWTGRREAVSLPGARDFLARVRGLGGHIAVVTNRRVSECPDTEAVLQAQGLVYDVVLCRPDDGPSDKDGRFEAVAEGTTPAGLPPLEVVAFLGDNIHDFPGQSQALRSQGDEAFEAFGDRFFVLPNAMYGSWE